MFYRILVKSVGIYQTDKLIVSLLTAALGFTMCCGMDKSNTTIRFTTVLQTFVALQAI